MEKKVKTSRWNKGLYCTWSVFIFYLYLLGGYPDVKKALKSRGWVQNPDPYSLCFDYKYALMARDIDMDGLKDF